MIRVAIVEDQADFRNHLEQLLRSGNGNCKRCGSYDSGEAALEELEKIRPDVVLVDIALPGISGIQLVRRLSVKLPQTQFMMLTALEDSEHLFESLRAGATGYLLKRDIFEKLLSSVVTLHEGGSPMTNSVARKVALEFRRFAENPDVVCKLTPREEEILRSVSRGKSNKEIAKMLALQPSTIETHLHNIYKKLQVNSRQEAARLLRNVAR